MFMNGSPAKSLGLYMEDIAGWHLLQPVRRRRTGRRWRHSAPQGRMNPIRLMAKMSTISVPDPSSQTFVSLRRDQAASPFLSHLSSSIPPFPLE
jgi:hypothetical protein